jgi:hypothetical protein
MPTFKWTGSNEAGYVTFGGIKFEKDQPMEVADPHQASKLEGHPEFELVGQGTDAGLGPVWNPPGPTVMGSGPGSGPYQTTHEVIDLPQGGELPPPEPAEVEEPPSEPPPPEEPPPEPPPAGLAEPQGPGTEDVPPFEATDEGPKKPKKK